MLESSEITSIKGIGPKSADRFAKAGIHTVADLITYYPRSYDTFGDPVPGGDLTLSDDGRKIAVEGRIERTLHVISLRGLKITSGKIRTAKGSLEVRWYNMPYLRTQISQGVIYIFRGIVRVKGTQIFLQQPAVYEKERYEVLRQTLQPVYPLVKGLTENALRKALQKVLSDPDGVTWDPDLYPDAFLKRYDLADRMSAIRDIHFPENEERLKTARRRLVFDEFFLFILMLRMIRTNRDIRLKKYILRKTSVTDRLLETLPYRLTHAQLACWQEISDDLSSEHVMERLVQGDVGSGKTIIAFLAMIQTAASGRQAAMMAPTEVLARQHFNAFQKLCAEHSLPYKSVLLTGSLRAAERKEAYRMIREKEADMVFGTHALIQGKVQFSTLSLVITDEQHRFGVRQREIFSKKGDEPDMIVMSATPIPRTLAVILYGDLDVSVIDEMPAERLPIRNAVVDAAWRPNAYKFIAKQVSEGHQAYVICPMVEESEEIDAENVIDYTQTIRIELMRYMPNITVEYLHGKMSNIQKQSIMERFSSNEIQVLVSTTVVEVGVNVPNATVMMIENAERFGLAQLHQLRGRVGRGRDQSYCIFLHASDNEVIRKRLDILASSNNGFEIAQKDLEMRGPGELFGVRQSGAISFALSDIYADAAIMQEAKEAAENVLSEDPELKSEDWKRIRDRLISFDSFI